MAKARSKTMSSRRRVSEVRGGSERLHDLFVAVRNQLGKRAPVLVGDWEESGRASRPPAAPPRARFHPRPVASRAARARRASQWRAAGLRSEIDWKLRSIERPLNRREKLNNIDQGVKARRDRARAPGRLAGIQSARASSSPSGLHYREVVERRETGFPRVLVRSQPRVKSLHDVKCVVVKAGPNVQPVLIGAVASRTYRGRSRPFLRAAIPAYRCDVVGLSGSCSVSSNAAVNALMPPPRIATRVSCRPSPPCPVPLR